MSPATPRAAAAISLEDLLAFNDELVALVRAGVPLERGLTELASDLTGRMNAIVYDVGQRVRAGQSLPQAISESRSRFPPVYAAIVEAGMRTGRLPIVLERLAAAARRMAELRRAVLVATVYPIVVVLLAYLLLVFFIIKVWPAFFKLIGVQHTFVLDGLAALERYQDWWVPAFPLVLLSVVGIWWYRMGRARILQSSRVPLGMHWIPGTGGMLSDARIAMLCDILALLVEHDVPLDQAMVLAGEASGDPVVADSARTAAASLLRGDNLSLGAHHMPGFPPLLRWLIATGHNQRMLVGLLKHSAEIYRGRALRRSQWLRIYLPVVLTVAIGGTATLLYALTVFVPITNLLQKLAGS